MSKKILSPNTGSPMSTLAQKTMVCYAKTGPAVYYSHHDIIRLWERSARRAQLPLRLTQGFNPHPRLIFPQALSVGISSRHEAVIFELCAPMELRDVQARLTDALAGALEITGVHQLPPVKQSPQLRATTYHVTGWAHPQLLVSAAPALLARPRIDVERGEPGKKRAIDIRPFVDDIRTERDGLFVRLNHSQAGSARPDEIANILAQQTDTDPAVLRIEKTGMELE